MNTKFFSFLLMLFLGLSLGFTSCSSDDDDDEDKTENPTDTQTSYTKGEEIGKEFMQAYDGYKNAEGTIEEAKAGLQLLSVYTKYKTNKNDAEWKKGFIAGAVKTDAQKSEKLSALLDTDLDFSSVTGIANAITELDKIFLQGN